MHTHNACLALGRRLTLLLLLVTSLLLAGQALAQGADPQGELATAVPPVDAEIWRQVKSGENFIDTRFESTYNLVNPSGETWRQIRERWVSPFGLIAVGGMAALILIFYLIVGRKDLEEPRTGRKLLRWSTLERALHWSVATLFIVLALTGLNLLYGKFVFRPLFGDGFWAAMMSGTKLLHNYLGPLFGILLIIILAKFLKMNIPNKRDWEWFKKGGGLVGKEHIDAHFANGGEKAWYWLLATAGLLVIASGLVMDFPNYGQSRDTMQWAHVIHSLGALALTAVALGHIYIGTIGTEGALEGMTTGYVDETWAKEHHNLWYEEVKDQAATPAPSASGNETGRTSEPPGTPG